MTENVKKDLKIKGRITRSVSVTFRETLLKEIDERARELNLSRSGYLSLIATKDIADKS